MDLVGGYVVMVFEGGYSLLFLCDVVELCVKVLLGEKVKYYVVSNY